MTALRSRLAAIRPLRRLNGSSGAVGILALTLAACSAPPRLPAPAMPAPSIATPTQAPPASNAADEASQSTARTAPPVVAAPTPTPDVQQFDRAAAFLSWVEQQERIYRVAAPILLHNTPLCPEHARNLLGFTAKTRHSYSSEFVHEAQLLLNLDDRLRVTEVLPGGSAALAGIREGDILIAAGIEPMPEGENAEKEAAALIASELQGQSAISMTVLRGEERMTLDIPLTSACAMPIDVGHTSEINAYADGERVMITSGMLNFVRSDDELAYVIAREVAKNALEPGPHPEASETIDRLRTPPAGASSANGPVVPDVPPAAHNPGIDRLALYMLARADYPLFPVVDFWNRLTSLQPRTANGNAGQSVTDRASFLADVIREINTRRERGMPLIPDAPMQ